MSLGWLLNSGPVPDQLRTGVFQASGEGCSTRISYNNESNRHFWFLTRHWITSFQLINSYAGPHGIST